MTQMNTFHFIKYIKTYPFQLPLKTKESHLVYYMLMCYNTLLIHKEKVHLGMSDNVGCHFLTKILHSQISDHQIQSCNHSNPCKGKQWILVFFIYVYTYYTVAVVRKPYMLKMVTCICESCSLFYCWTVHSTNKLVV